MASETKGTPQKAQVPQGPDRPLLDLSDAAIKPDMRVGQHSPLSWRTSFRAW